MKAHERCETSSAILFTWFGYRQRKLYLLSIGQALDYLFQGGGKVSEEFYQLSELRTEFIEQLRNRTITAILVISLTYLLTFILLSVILITSRASYCIFTLVIPLFMYLWLSTYGGIKHVNNHYKFKQTSEGTLLFKKKRRENYSTYTFVWALIFLISSIIRLICEIRNLKVINAELINRSK